MRSTRVASWCLLLSVIGLGLSGYLFFLHLGLLRGELIAAPGCSGSGVFNCHAVTAGAWGSFLGMPLSVWGLLGYLAVFALSLLAWQSEEDARAALTLTFVLAVIFVGMDLALFGLMAFVIRFYCLFCLLTYAVNLLLLIVSARGTGRPLAAFGQLGSATRALLPSGRHPATILFWGLLLVGCAGGVGLHAATSYLSLGSAGAMQKQVREFVVKQPRVSVVLDNDPVLGPANAPIRLIEFSDFFCPSCQRASKMNTIILASHRRDLQFVFKHYPLDTACNTAISRSVHPGACQVAAASECAHLQGKFWPFHDRVFEKGHDYKLKDLAADAQGVGLDVATFQACLDSGQGMEAVKRDIAEGARIGVTSTPTYFLNGVPLSGGLSPAVFEQVVAVVRGQ